jgi:PTS system galactitol-specific IIA component
MAVIFRELINSSISAANSEDAIRKVGKLFFDNGYVKDTYVDAVAVREKKYPTGLQLKEIAVAMPHTDSIHVCKPGICVARLTEPVKFAHMGETEKSVDAEVIFMMAIQNPEDQIDTLKKVLNVFSSEEAARKFKNAKTDDELFEVAKQYLD